MQFGEMPLVIVDYMQDLARGTDERNVRTKIGSIASKLRSMAQRIDCPMVAVSSVSRAYYASAKQQAMRAADDPTVYLAAAKESGDVDYASAAVIFVDTDEAVQGEGAERHRLARLAVAKSRHGETGFVGARFFGASGRWTADDQATAKMSSVGKVEQRLDQQASDDLARVLTAVRAHPSLLWRYLRDKTGIPSKRADAAKQRLRGMTEGTRLEAVTETYLNHLSQTRKRDVLRVVDTMPDRAAEPSKPPAPLALPDPALTHIFARFGADQRAAAAR
jgi:hypothetical protein